MGRQYNYFISPKEDKNFVKYLLDNNFIILEPQKEIKNNDETWNWEELKICKCSKQNDEDFFIPYKTYIYKKEWGELKQNQKGYFDFVMKSPVIEHIHCLINSENRLSRGRLYFPTYYKDEIEAFDTIYKEYQRLVRKMKKNIIYKDYVFKNGKRIGWPFSQEAIGIIENGCKIGV